MEVLKMKNTEYNELPTNPMEVAKMLINSQYLYKPSNAEKQLLKCGDIVECERYTVDDLEQIAEHLLVYCKHNKDN